MYKLSQKFMFESFINDSNNVRLYDVSRTHEELPDAQKI